ncbi:hypothetical protein L218DRAFT_951533 [Marasmius fiardii PR-910]|nr:hypothetical protein L218DRAFT_951533 [Marasmius fiardii PR-910]
MTSIIKSSLKKWAMVDGQNRQARWRKKYREKTNFQTSMRPVTNPSFHLIVLQRPWHLVVATPLKRTVAQVEADETSISNRINALDNASNAFSNTLAIHNLTISLVATIDQATTDVNHLRKTSEHTRQSKGSCQPFRTGLNGLVTKKAAFQALPLGGVPGLIKQDLASLATATVAFENSIIAKAPADLRSFAVNSANMIN